MLERRAFIAGLGATAAGLALSCPAFAPPGFDAAGYVRDLRCAGHRVYLLRHDGNEWFGIGSSRGLGFGKAYSEVQARWRDRIDTDPDFVNRVIDFLRSERA